MKDPQVWTWGFSSWRKGVPGGYTGSGKEEDKN